MKVTLALTFLLIAAPDFASAQSSAAEHFAAGVGDMERMDFEAALAHFEAAEVLHPHGVNQFNIGSCLEELGRIREAVTGYQLALESTQLAEDRAREARLRVDRLQMRLGTVHIHGTGVEVRLGEQSCTAPCEVLVDPGRHSIRWSTGSAAVAVPAGGQVHVEIPAPSAPPTPAPPPVVQTSNARWFALGGGLVIALGTAGAVGFGLHTESLKDDFDRFLTPELQAEGIRFRRLTNASIAIAGAGAVLVLVGVVLGARSSRAPVGVSQNGLSFSF